MKKDMIDNHPRGFRAGKHYTLEGGPMDFAEIEQRYAGMMSKKKHKSVKPIDPDTRRDMIMHDLDFGMRYGTNSPQELENMSYALGVRYGHNTAIRRAHMQHMCDMLTKLEEDFND